MPEIITKYPDVVLTILKDAKIACGAGKPQQILKHCPKDQFCSLPSGELCIYDVKQVASLSQISSLDLLMIPSIAFNFILLFLLVFLAGMMTGIYLQRKNR